MDYAGRILNERYRLLEPAGSGGMAHVWRAECVTADESTVAIKRPRADLDNQGDVRSMFLDEARVMSGLRHPNIVQCLDCGRDETGPYLVLEWIEGVTGREIVDRRPDLLPAEAIVPLACDLLAALGEVHRGKSQEGRLVRLPVIHRDVSLSNVLIGLDGTTKLSDFGLARSLAHPRTNPRGMARGKLAYMPPESLSGAPHGVRGDLYSVGVVLWEALTGGSLFSELRTQAARVRALMETERPNVLTRRRDVPPAIAAVIAKALAVDPAERYGRADEMAIAMREAVEPAQLSRGRSLLAVCAAEALAARQQRRDVSLRTSDAPQAPAATQRTDTITALAPQRAAVA